MYINVISLYNKNPKVLRMFLIIESAFRDEYLVSIIRNCIEQKNIETSVFAKESVKL